MKLKKKFEENKNFTKLTQKKGISLIVLIITIIVIIILAAAVILTIGKNNPVYSAKEATFKEDMASMQDELSMYISKKYTDNPASFEKTSVNMSGDSMVTELPSTKKYKKKVEVVKGNLVWIGETDNNAEYKWFTEVIGNTSNIKEEWQDTIESVKDGVPIPKGFIYKEGTKDSGLVIQDVRGNEFVWIPSTEETYVKDFSFPSWYGASENNTSDDTLPNGITDEIADVKKYGGFYIGRYEAGIPKGDTSPSNKEGIPVSKKGAIVWTNINYTNAKASAESMINNEYVQTGLMTGRAWDRTCHWIEDSVTSLTDSGTYGNYNDSLLPAKVTGYGEKQVAGYSDEWMVKNIYDLAGNVWEMENETGRLGKMSYVCRGGCFANDAKGAPISSRYDWLSRSDIFNSQGFRVRLYIINVD